jgi:hypothetical protein
LESVTFFSKLLGKAASKLDKAAFMDMRITDEQIAYHHKLVRRQHFMERPPQKEYKS